MLEKKEIELKKKKYYYSILEARINDLNYSKNNFKIENYNSILDCLESKKRFTEKKINEYNISLKPFSLNLSETIKFILKKETPPNDKFIYRLYLCLLKFEIFNKINTIYKPNSKKFDNSICEIIEIVQNMEEYITLPVEIL
jgi:hypothetical protein